ncbi:MAG: hypothetical protein AB9873_04790 [Syntrophobacteraceae bacterium]
MESSFSLPPHRWHKWPALTRSLNADDDFATLKSGGAEVKAPIAQISCPRPLPANEIEGKTVFCGTVQVPEDNSMPDGKKITLQFAILKTHSQYPEPDPPVSRASP